MATNRRGKRGGRTLPQGLDRRLANYSRPSLLTLSTAAGASPTARHRWPSLAHVIARALVAGNGGSKVAAPSHVGQLLDAAMRDDPRLSTMEDFVPNDPRLEVLARRGERLVRLFPGSVERPVADIERSDMVAAAADDFLIPRHGFGVRDYVDTGLIYMDHAVSVLAPSWAPTDEIQERDVPPSVTQAEVDAAAVLETVPPPSDILNSARRVAALGYATCPVSQLPYEPDHPQSIFGRFLAVAIPGPDGASLPQPLKADTGLWWLPPAYLPDALGYGVAQLASEGASDITCARRFAQLAADRTRRALWRFGDLLGPADHESGPVVSPQDVVQWVSLLGDARAVLVQLVARLSLDRLPFTQEPAAVRICREAEDATEPIRIPMPNGVLTVDSRTELVPLLLVATAGHVVAPQGPGFAGMSLDDLVWASRTADADSDLFMFCRELSASDAPPMFGWEAINYWEWWRRNGKTFFGGGAAPTFMSIQPHWGDAEWLAAADRAALERALLASKLPPTSAFDVIEGTGSGPPALYSWGEPWEPS